MCGLLGAGHAERGGPSGKGCALGFRARFRPNLSIEETGANRFES